MILLLSRGALFRFAVRHSGLSRYFLDERSQRELFIMHFYALLCCVFIGIYLVSHCSAAIGVF